MQNWSRQTPERISIMPVRWGVAPSGFAEIKKELIVKFAKGVAFFVVLCLASYGAFTLLKKPPQLDVPESDVSYLEDLGIHVQSGQASESGLSGMLNDVQGVAPVGSSVGVSSSSAPPSFFAAPETSFADPFDSAPAFAAPSSLDAAPPFETAPHVASANTSVSDPLSPSDVADQAVPNPISTDPMPDAVDPDFSSPEVLTLPASEGAVMPVTDAPTFDTSVSEAAPPFIPASPVPSPVLVTQAPPPDQSPPPIEESWDGPSSGISVTPPPAELLQSPPPANEQIPYQPVEKKIRRITPDSTSPRRTTVQVTTLNFSESDNPSPPLRTASDNAPLNVSQPSSPAYTRTSVRQPLSFTPVKPEIQPNVPMVTFGSPRQHSPAVVPPALPVVQAQNVTLPQAPVFATNPATSSAAHEMVKQFVQTQEQLVKSGSPENVRHAFIQLSQLHEHHSLDMQQRAALQPMLDSLALKVIYAKDCHILEAPYQVKPGETIESIAQSFNLLPTLLRKMNGLSSSQELPPGTTLKVVFGQFDARISLKRQELTLLLGGLYAGRFAFSLPQAGLPINQGEFYVTNRTDQSIVLNNGWMLAPEHVPNATIVFAQNDFREIIDILSEQSVVILE